MTDESTPYVMKATEISLRHDLLWDGRWIGITAIDGEGAEASDGHGMTLRFTDGDWCVRDRKPSQPQSLRERLEQIARDPPVPCG
jgi:hypothetical protein